MLRFVVRRLLLLVPILLGLSILVFVWIRALPGCRREALLGERATPERDRADQPPVRARPADLRAVLELPRRRLAQRRPRHEHHDAAARSRTSSDSASRRRSSSRSRRCSSRSSSASRSASSRRSATAAAFDHVIPGRLADRDLDPDLLPRADPQVHLRREARLAAEHRARGRAGDAPHPTNFYILDAIIERRPGRVLGRAQASDPAGDRARLDPARDHRAHHARRGARRAERGLRAHGAREGPAAASSSTAATCCGTRCCRSRRSSACRPACCSRARSSPRRCSPGPGIGSWLQARRSSTATTRCSRAGSCSSRSSSSS